MPMMMPSVARSLTEGGKILNTAGGAKLTVVLKATEAATTKLESL